MPKSKKRGKHTPPFTAAQKKAIASAYRKGGNLIGLSAQYKCSTSKIRKVLSEANVAMRPRGPVAKPKAKKAKAKKASKPKTSKPKAVAKADVSASKRELTPAQREAKNKADRDRRAAKKQGLKATLAAVAAPAAEH